MKSRIAVIAGLLLVVALCILIICQPVIAGPNSERGDEQEAFGMGTRADIPVQNSPAAEPVIVPVETEKAEVKAETKGETPQPSMPVSEPRHTQPREKSSVERKESRSVVTIRETTPKRKTVDTVASVEAGESAAPETVSEEPSGRQDKIAMLLEGDKPERPAANDDRGITAGSLISTVLKLGIVLALAYVTILVLKWLSNKKPVVLNNTSRDLKVVDTIRLSPSNTLHIINARGKTLLIGCSSGQVNVLEELEDESAEEEPVLATGKGNFSDYLQKYSESAGYNTPAARVAGVLRDCTEHLRKKRSSISDKTGGSDEA